MKKGQRVVVLELGPAHGKTGQVIGVRRNFLGIKHILHGYVVQLDNGEVVYAGGIKKLKRKDPVAI